MNCVGYIIHWLWEGVCTFVHKEGISEQVTEEDALDLRRRK